MKRASSAHRRSLLHANKLEAFKEWVIAEGKYDILPKTKHPYEVLRLRERFAFDGVPEELFFYKKSRTEHITIPGDGEFLVKRFIESRKKKHATSD